MQNILQNSYKEASGHFISAYQFLQRRLLFFKIGQISGLQKHISTISSHQVQFMFAISISPLEAAEDEQTVYTLKNN